jgi:hypothetical protein
MQDNNYKKYQKGKVILMNSTKPKIFIAQRNNRFINGLTGYQSPVADIVHTNVNKNIYNIYYSLHFNYCIINLSNIDNELVQFISEYSSSIKIFIYFDIQGYSDTNIIESLKNSVYYLIPASTYNTYAQYDHTVMVPDHLINSELFHRNNTIEKTQDSICFFLDQCESIPESLMAKLYPATKQRITLYNNNNIKHPQNLGVVSEMDKAYILNKSEYFINHNNYYIFEAINCGCKIIDINDIDITKCQNISTQITNYDNFLKEYIL